jgi:hypothetical protein
LWAKVDPSFVIIDRFTVTSVSPGGCGFFVRTRLLKQKNEGSEASHHPGHHPESVDITDHDRLLGNRSGKLRRRHPPPPAETKLVL